MIYLHRKDVKLIGEIMDQFPDAHSFRLDCEEGGGIGNTLKLTITTDIGNRPADVTFEIAGAADW